MAKKKSGVLINTVALLAVTFVCVALLAVVNQITRGPIEQAEIEARAAAYSAVYPGAPGFAEVENTQEMLDSSAELLENSGCGGCSIDDVLSVTDNSGAVQGYVVSATSPSGYGGDLQIAIGITADGKLTGFDVISHSETPGFGAKSTEPEFKNQFAGKPASKLSYSKTGAASETEFDAVSGATITTKAVEEAVNSAIVFYQENFAGGVQTSEKGE